MPNHASVTLVGHLGADPATKHLPSGDVVCQFSLATTRKRKDEALTTWWRCAMWGKRGEVIARHLRKGDPILVTGEPHLRPWTDQSGAQRASLDVEVRDFSFIGGKGEVPRDTTPAREARWDEAGVADDDIPFAAHERGWVA